MNFKKKKRFNDNTGKPKELGSFLHFCEDLVIVKLSNCDYIPFPNSLVLNKNNKVIGKIEEVLGPQNEVYVAIKREIKEDYDLKSIFYCYENKFIPKERFMERSEVEKKKEEGDKKVKDSGGRGGRSKDRGDKSKGDRNKGKDWNRGDKVRGDKKVDFKGNKNRSFGDRKSFNDRKKQWNKR